VPLRSTARHQRSERRRLAAQAVVLALVVAGTTAFATLHKTVTLDVDGEVATVSAFGRTVADVLAAQGVDVGEGDLVAPTEDTLLANGDQVVVRHGHEVVVEVDGEPRTVWTTALTVEEMLAELGLRGEVRASASRSAGLDGSLRVSTLKTVHVAVDGTTQDLVTTASTVREALTELGVVLGEHDRVSVSLDASAVDGLVVMIDRVTGVTRSETVGEPFATIRQDDATLAQGREVVAQTGREGAKVVTFLAYEVGGVETGRIVLAESVVTPPVAQVVRVGTFVGPDPASIAPVEPGTARAIAHDMVLARGWDESQFACLDELWSRESGWRVNASNSSSGAYGIPQALPGSKMASAGADWQSNPATQITWGLGYITDRYGSPCDAWAFFQARGWY
jgi:uncharacterized protein YabE (DUF348 family)